MAPTVYKSLASYRCAWSFHSTYSAGVDLYQAQHKPETLERRTATPAMSLLIITSVLAFNAVIPTKSWRIGGVSLGDWVAIGCYTAAILRWLTLNRQRVRPPHRIWFMCIAAVALSVVLCWASARDREYLFENGRQVIHYFFVFPMICYACDRTRLMRVLQVYLVTGLVAAALLHLYHFVPSLVTWDSGTGAFWAGSAPTAARIFTPGMQYVFVALLALTAYIPSARGANLIWYSAAYSVMLSAIAWTGVRSYFVILGVCLGVLLTVLGCTMQARRLLTLTWAAVVTAVCAYSLFGEAAGNVTLRLATLAGLQETRLTEFDTMGWRVSDAGNALSVIEGPREWLFGVFAKPYASGEWYGATPHIAYAGLVYHFGIFGSACFACLLIAISHRLFVRFSRLVRAGTYDPLLTAGGLVWVGLLLYSFVGGTFISAPSIISLIIVEFISILPPRARIVSKAARQNYENLHCYAFLQPRSVFGPGDSERFGPTLPEH